MMSPTGTEDVDAFGAPVNGRSVVVGCGALDATDDVGWRWNHSRAS